MFANSNVQALCTNLRVGYSVGNVQGNPVQLVSKENVLNDLLNIRIVKCVGYGRVAGQAAADLNREIVERNSEIVEPSKLEGKSRRSEGQTSSRTSSPGENMNEGEE